MLRILFGTVTLAVLSVPACSPDVFGPARDELAGRYISTVFASSTLSGEFDYLSGGAFLELLLNPDGTVSGRLLMPNWGSGGADLDSKLSGKWHRFGSRISVKPALPIGDADREPFVIQPDGKLRTVFGPVDGIMVIELTKVIPTDP